MKRIPKPKITIDQKARMGYIDIDGSNQNTMVARTIQAHPGVNIDVGWLGQVVGIELFFAGHERTDSGTE